MANKQISMEQFMDVAVERRKFELELLNLTTRVDMTDELNQALLDMNNAMTRIMTELKKSVK